MVFWGCVHQIKNFSRRQGPRLLVLPIYTPKQHLQSKTKPLGNAQEALLLAYSEWASYLAITFTISKHLLE